MPTIVIFDWKRTLYDPEKKTLIDGALDLLRHLQIKSMPMVLVGKGGEDMNSEVDRLGVRAYFKKIIFAEGDKDPSAYAPYVPADDAKKAIFIGDRVRSELEIGNRFGATTIWVKQGKFAEEEPENDAQIPNYTLKSLQEVLQMFEKDVLGTHIWRTD